MLSPEHETPIHDDNIEPEEATLPLTESMQKATWIIVFFIFGIALLSPWNIWLKQKEYFSFRLQGYVFAGSFESWISVTFQIVNIATLLFLLKSPNAFSVNQRIVSGLCLSILIFLLAA